MKITIVQGAFFPVPPLMGGAVEKVWFSLGKEFAKCGHEVTHISRCHPDLPRQQYIEGVRHIRMPGYKVPRSRKLLLLCDLVYAWRVLRILPRADILVTNTIWMPILVRTRKYGAVYVHAARYPKGQMKFYKHVARLQTVSTAVARAIVREVPECEGKVRSIANPLPYDIEETDISESWVERKKSFLYVGRVHPEKGIDLLLEAFARFVQSEVTDWRLTIVGPWKTSLGGGGGEYYQALRKKANRIEVHVDWVGSVFDPEELANYYKYAMLFVYPSLAERGETFGLAPLEAMSFGCPPLVSSLECFRDFIEDGKSGCVFDHRANDSVAELEKRMRYLVGSPQQLMTMGENARRVAKRYTLKNVAGLYLEDFEALRSGM